MHFHNTIFSQRENHIGEIAYPFPFLFVAMVEAMGICNSYDQSDINTVVLEKDEYGGTYDRPWIFARFRFLNDHGDTVHHGR